MNATRLPSLPCPAAPNHHIQRTCNAPPLIPGVLIALWAFAAEGEVSRNDAASGIPGSASNSVLRVMLQMRWSAEAWSQVRVEFRRALALRSEIRRADWLAWKATGSE